VGTPDCDLAGIGPPAFAHVGSYHAGIVVRRALFRLPAWVDYAALPQVIYTDPELAQVGLTEAEAGKRAAGSYFTPKLFGALPRRLVGLLRHLR
jgi:pyruvate/2-oxoglutarate dehydrogenase complex dihydrolipoamide dehydrogenase (E3) component